MQSTNMAACSMAFKRAWALRKWLKSTIGLALQVGIGVSSAAVLAGRRWLSSVSSGLREVCSLRSRGCTIPDGRNHRRRSPCSSAGIYTGGLGREQCGFGTAPDLDVHDSKLDVLTLPRELDVASSNRAPACPLHCMGSNILDGESTS